MFETIIIEVYKYSHLQLEKYNHMAELLKATGIYYRNELRSIHKNGVKLQPVYEAFTNSWESILEKYTAEHLNLGSIVIEIHYMQAYLKKIMKTT